MSHLQTYLRLVSSCERTLGDALRTVAAGHAQQPDVFHMCHTLAQMSESHVRALVPVLDRYQEDDDAERPAGPARIEPRALAEVREGQLGLLRDLQDLQLLATLVQSTWTVLKQAAQAARDRELLDLATSANGQTSRQLSWLTTTIKAAAPQAILVAP